MLSTLKAGVLPLNFSPRPLGTSHMWKLFIFIGFISLGIMSFSLIYAAAHSKSSFHFRLNNGLVCEYSVFWVLFFQGMPGAMALPLSSIRRNIFTLVYLFIRQRAFRLLPFFGY